MVLTSHIRGYEVVVQIFLDDDAKAKASGILVVVGVGSYLAYRLCVKYLGPNFLSTLLMQLKTATTPAIPSHINDISDFQPRQFHGAYDILADDEWSDDDDDMSQATSSTFLPLDSPHADNRFHRWLADEECVINPRIRKYHTEQFHQRSPVQRFLNACSTLSPPHHRRHSTSPYNKKNSHTPDNPSRSNIKSNFRNNNLNETPDLSTCTPNTFTPNNSNCSPNHTPPLATSSPAIRIRGFPQLPKQGGGRVCVSHGASPIHGRRNLSAAAAKAEAAKTSRRVSSNHLLAADLRGNALHPTLSQGSQLLSPTSSDEEGGAFDPWSCNSPPPLRRKRPKNLSLGIDNNNKPGCGPVNGGSLSSMPSIPPFAQAETFSTGKNTHKVKVKVRGAATDTLNEPAEERFTRKGRHGSFVGSSVGDGYPTAQQFFWEPLCTPDIEGDDISRLQTVLDRASPNTARELLHKFLGRSSPAPSEVSEISLAANIQLGEDTTDNLNRLQGDITDIKDEVQGLTSDVSHLVERSKCLASSKELYRSVVLAPSDLSSEIGSITSIDNLSSIKPSSQHFPLFSHSSYPLSKLGANSNFVPTPPSLSVSGYLTSPVLSERRRNSGSSSSPFTRRAKSLHKSQSPPSVTTNLISLPPNLDPKNQWPNMKNQRSNQQQGLLAISEMVRSGDSYETHLSMDRTPSSSGEDGGYGGNLLSAGSSNPKLVTSGSGSCSVEKLVDKTRSPLIDSAIWTDPGSSDCGSELPSDHLQSSWLSRSRSIGRSLGVTPEEPSVPLTKETSSDSASEFFGGFGPRSVSQYISQMAENDQPLESEAGAVGCESGVIGNCEFPPGMGIQQQHDDNMSTVDRHRRSMRRMSPCGSVSISELSMEWENCFGNTPPEFCAGAGEELSLKLGIDNLEGLFRSIKGLNEEMGRSQSSHQSNTKNTSADDMTTSTASSSCRGNQAERLPSGTRDLKVFANEFCFANPSVTKVLHQLYRKRKLERVLWLGETHAAPLFASLHALLYQGVPLFKCNSFRVVAEACQMSLKRCNFLNQWPINQEIVQFLHLITLHPQSNNAPILCQKSLEKYFIRCLKTLWDLHEANKHGTAWKALDDKSQSLQILEGIKILMVLRLLEVYEDTMYTRQTTHAFYSDLFRNNDPHNLMQHMHNLGTQRDFSHMELAVLADSLGVRLEIFRLHSVNPHVAAVFPEKSLKQSPTLTLLELTSDRFLPLFQSPSHTF